MDMIYWAIIALVAFVAIWMFFVAPAERRHHERKLEMLQKRIDNRQSQIDQEQPDAAGDEESEVNESR